MPPNLLILGGTTEATALAKAVAAAKTRATVSFAGRVARPIRQPLPQRIGGFGGAAGLADYLRKNTVTHVIDATHPFAARMSFNAVSACSELGVPLIALTRPTWQARPGDRWEHVADIPGAVDVLDCASKRVMLAIGRMNLKAFAANPQHDYLLRLIDPPEKPLPLPRAEIIVDRGPFTTAGDISLLRRHRAQLVVSKNSGGSGARAKIEAARQLGLPVLMIDRPRMPERREVQDIDSVLAWIGHSTTARGV